MHPQPHRLDMADFDTALASFVEGCKRITGEHYTKNFPKLSPPTWQVDRLQKRVRISQPGHGVHCFIDIATGDVLKAASWSTPAKHARGNIFDEHNGLNRMGPYGPAYLR